MTLENPEAEGQIYSVAPAEGQRPLSMMTDKMFEAMSNSDKFPYGSVGTFSSDRQWETKLTYRKYFNQRLLIGCHWKVCSRYRLLVCCPVYSGDRTSY